MRGPYTVTLNTVTSSAWYPLDYKQTPFTVSVAVDVTGTINYTVQYCLENILAGDTAVPRSAEDTTLVAATASQAGAITSPVTGVRLTVNSVTGGSATMTVLQGGAS